MISTFNKQAIVQRVIRRQGGKIRTEAEQNKEATFYFTSGSQETINMNEKYVLLVEDNPDDVDLTRIAFKRCRIPNELIVVGDGQEALDFLYGKGKFSGRDTSKLPAVMILDLKLPCVGGVEVLKRVRLESNDLCHLQVVILSSSMDKQEVDTCERMGIFRFYRKPMNFLEFKRIIEEIQDSFLE
jgi:two-component system, response regulator